MKIGKSLLAVLLISAFASAAHAEKADRDQPIQIDANQFNGDDLKQVAVYTGRVLLIQGTMRITGERMDIRVDPEGYHYGVVTAAPGQLATFRERRDPTKPGIEEYVEGYGERIEYDEKADTIKLITRARYRRLENEQQRDEQRGDVITYEQTTGKLAVSGGKASSPDQTGPDGRVHSIIAPRSQESKPGASTPLAPATQIARPPKE